MKKLLTVKEEENGENQIQILGVSNKEYAKKGNVVIIMASSRLASSPHGIGNLHKIILICA